MEKLAPNILGRILVTLDVRDLVRCKSVCKSWDSFISRDYFVKAHLKHSCNNDRNNNNFGVRRIVMSCPRTSFNGYRSIKNYNIVGSSDGLVCICSSDGRVLVANPSTRVFRILPYPETEDIPGFHQFLGFGYDTCSDDYKVVALGEFNGFQVFSLKTNVWRSLGKLKYNYSRCDGILCNGAIHWLMTEQIAKNTLKYVIVAFDLSTEKINKIPLPEYDVRFEVSELSYLGIIDDCLCISNPTRTHCTRWVMKRYDAKQSWTIYVPHDQKVNDAIQTLEQLEADYVQHKSFFTSHDMIQLRCVNEHVCAPIYVPSLVSPYVWWKLKRKRMPKRNRKMFKRVRRLMLWNSRLRPIA